jgi:uncharacterized tellurite resistance protein B-like protein
VSILRFLGFDEGAIKDSSAATETVRKIADALDRLDPARAKYIAAFAYLLSRVARADLDISSEETRVMEEIVTERGGLPQEQAVIVVQMAKTQNILFGSTENYLVAREFNTMATHEQKIGLLHCLFAVASADKSVSTVEDNEISQIADALRIEHRDLVAARSQHRKYLAVLQKPE